MAERSVPDVHRLLFQNFISEIRACSGKDAEKNRVDKELGKIRKKFSSAGNVSGGAHGTHDSDDEHSVADRHGCHPAHAGKLSNRGAGNSVMGRCLAASAGSSRPLPSHSRLGSCLILGKQVASAAAQLNGVVLPGPCGLPAQQTASSLAHGAEGARCLCAEYDKKKYVWKLLYIYMLGYPVEFGHKQASDLIAAGK